MENLYPQTGNYRKLRSTFDLFFKEVRLTYGRQICREVKKEAFQDFIKLGDPQRIEELDEISALRRVISRYPPIFEYMNESCKMRLGAAA